MLKIPSIICGFVAVPQGEDLKFFLVDENGRRKFYTVAAYDLAILKEEANSESYKTPKMLRAFSYFPSGGLPPQNPQCREPLMEDGINPALDPHQQPKKDMPDTTKVVEKNPSHTETPPERDAKWKEDVGGL